MRCKKNTPIGEQSQATDKTSGCLSPSKNQISEKKNLQ